MSSRIGPPSLAEWIIKHSRNLVHIVATGIVIGTVAALAVAWLGKPMGPHGLILIWCMSYLIMVGFGIVRLCNGKLWVEAALTGAVSLLIIALVYLFGLHALQLLGFMPPPVIVYPVTP